MYWIDFLEKRLERFAIPGLMKVIVAFNALVFLLLRVNPEFGNALTLRQDRILQGEVWRLFTYLFIPETGNVFFVLIFLWFLWFVGEALEEAWGSFRLNLFYFLGMVGGTIAAFFFGGDSTGFYLNLSLLFAFTTIYPDFKLLLFLILPVQARWIGWVSLGMVLFNFVGGTMTSRMAILVALANYLIFFGPILFKNFRNKNQIAVRRARFEAAKRDDSDSLYCCTVCGRTEKTNPELEFRVAKDGEDYCTEHLPGKVS